MKTLKIKQLRDAPRPQRGTSYSAGLDWFIPFGLWPETDGVKVLFPGEDINIPLGWAVQMEPEYCMLMLAKSGRATNDKLIVGACLIDADYPDEIHGHIFNNGQSTVRLIEGTKIVQSIVLPAVYHSIEVVDTIVPHGGQRIGGFGSTGLK